MQKPQFHFIRPKTLRQTIHRLTPNHPDTKTTKRTSSTRKLSKMLTFHQYVHRFWRPADHFTSKSSNQKAQNSYAKPSNILRLTSHPFTPIRQIINPSERTNTTPQAESDKPPHPNLPQRAQSRNIPHPPSPRGIPSFYTIADMRDSLPNSTHPPDIRALASPSCITEDNDPPVDCALAPPEHASQQTFLPELPFL